ncbi:MAG: tetratricopeptide repeat protein [Bacteroidales bacterium]
MSEEKDRYYSDNGFVNLMRRYEEMVSQSARYYFDVDEFEEIIDHYMGQGKSNRAYNATQHAINLHPSSTSIRLKMAVILNDKSQPLESLNILNTIEKIEFNNPEVHFTKGMALNLLGQAKDAVKYFNKAVMLTDEAKEDILFNIAIAFEQQSHFTLALRYLFQAYDLEPGNLSYIYDIAYCYERIDKLDKALDFYNRYLDKDPFSENVWYNMGVIYNRMENYDKAIEAYDFAISLDEEYSSAYFNKANTLANSGNYKSAITVYKELLYLEENNEQVICYIGECYEKIELWDEALKYYRKSLSVNPDYADAWLGRGMVMFAKGEYNKSLCYVEKAIELFPDSSEYWYSLGNIYIKLGRPVDAINSYRKAVKFDPGDFDSWINLAETFLQFKDYDMAVQVLTEASGINPGIALFNYRLAAYSLMNNDGEKADHFLRIALSLDYEAHNDFLKYYPEAARIKSVKDLLKTFNKT